MRTRTWDTARADRLRAEGKNNAEVAELVGTTPVAVGLYFRAKSGATAKPPKTVTPDATVGRILAPVAAKPVIPPPAFGVDIATLADILGVVAAENPTALVMVGDLAVAGVMITALPSGEGKDGGVVVRLMTGGGVDSAP